MRIFLLVLIFSGFCGSQLGTKKTEDEQICEEGSNPSSKYTEGSNRHCASNTNIEGASDSVDDGGWSTFDAGADAQDLIRRLAPFERLCNVERRGFDELTQAEFLHRYALTRPVILVGASDNQAITAATSKARLIEDYGRYVIRLSTANTHSYKKEDTTLSNYIDDVMRPQSLGIKGNETFYWFGDNNYTEFAPLFSAYNPPGFSLPDKTPAFSFGVAAVGTGVPFHWHGPGFAEVIHGRKMWFLSPPDLEPKFHPDLPTLHWLLNDFNTIPEEDPKPSICTIEPGEAIFFPDRWWHATLNTRTSVFISTFLG